ncbi:Protein LAZY like [Actinidia chinensis var. chinensis]|uniref:Protein LAZY like n=1 Tax=Actinidia chinensis var. chinensis TaxID=1590841 RepID=A0A2R6REI6_ACTCC|nr:Protein LAZY like [Actinidia chinensis var. chinensis]
MHRKFRSSEPLKDFAIGNSCLSGQPILDDQQYYPKSNYCTRTLSKAQRDNHLRNSFASLESARVEDDDFEEESSAAISELFHGFLTIGTLGSDPVIIDHPSTPTFAISVENITENETEVTENDLKLINDELEKVLGAEDGCNDSSGRNSHVSNGRSSHGSTITLSGKPLEGTETTICPLQGYLFGSAIELPETTAVKKEHRTSLGELFQRTKITEETSVARCERGEKRTDKETDKSAIHLMKKMLKKRMVNASSRTSTTVTGGNVDSSSTETKLHKILHKFHRKVYPESSAGAQKSDKPHKNEMKNITTYEGAYNNADCMLQDEDIIIFPQRSLSKLSKENLRRIKNQYNPSQVTISGSDSNENREYWIKTDADYLVLEL